MLKLLPVEKYSLLHEIGQLHQFPLISSVIFGKQDGNIFVDHIDEPAVILIIHSCTFGYFYSAANIEVDYNAVLDFCYGSELIPQYFHIYDADDQLVRASEGRSDFNFRLRERMRMKKTDNISPEPIPNDFTVKNIGEVTDEQLALFNLNVVGKYWRTGGEFTTESCGVVIFDGEIPVSICYLVCVVKGLSEPDILTMPDYRGKGLAVVACDALLNEVRKRGIRMDWDVFEDNVPSIRVIEKFGYKPYKHYRFLSLFKIK